MSALCILEQARRNCITPVKILLINLKRRRDLLLNRYAAKTRPVPPGYLVIILYCSFAYLLERVHHATDYAKMSKIILIRNAMISGTRLTVLAFTSHLVAEAQVRQSKPVIL